MEHFGITLMTLDANFLHFLTQFPFPYPTEIILNLIFQLHKTCLLHLTNPPPLHQRITLPVLLKQNVGTIYFSFSDKWYVQHASVSLLHVTDTVD